MTFAWRNHVRVQPNGSSDSLFILAIKSLLPLSSPYSVFTIAIAVSPGSPRASPQTSSSPTRPKSMRKGPTIRATTKRLGTPLSRQPWPDTRPGRSSHLLTCLLPGYTHHHDIDTRYTAVLRSQFGVNPTYFSITTSPKGSSVRFR